MRLKMLMIGMLCVANLCLAQPKEVPPPLRTVREVVELGDREHKLVLYTTWATIGYITTLMRDVLSSKREGVWETTWKMLNDITYGNPDEAYRTIHAMRELAPANEKVRRVYNNSRYIETIMTLLTNVKFQ